MPHFFGRSYGTILAALAVSTFPLLAPSDARTQPVVWSRNGHAYEYVDELVHWSEARTLATQRPAPPGFFQGRLVTIEDQAENSFLVRSFDGRGYAWIGFTDETVEGEWRWIDDTPGIWQDPQVFQPPIQTAFTRWRSGEPSGLEDDEDYGIIQIFENGIWNDGRGPAGLPFQYIVEWQPVATTPIPGDYDGSRRVEQRDLDLVLLFWGDDASIAPTFDGLPDILTATVDQDDLDKVLLNWGASEDDFLVSAAVPEPAAWLLVLLAAASAWRRRSYPRRR